MSISSSIGRGPTTAALGWLGSNTTNANLLKGLQIPVLYCPSSPLPWSALYDPVQVYSNSGVQTGTIVINASDTMYTGNSGATNDVTARNKANTGVAPGRISFGGVLISLASVTVADIRDGTTNTLMVGEQSDWCRDASGTLSDCRSDCGHSFCMGPGNDGWDRTFNITTVVNPINEKSANAYGVPANCGPNRSFQSAHLAEPNSFGGWLRSLPGRNARHSNPVQPVQSKRRQCDHPGMVTADWPRRSAGLAWRGRRGAGNLDDRLPATTAARKGSWSSDLRGCARSNKRVRFSQQHFRSAHDRRRRRRRTLCGIDRQGAWAAARRISSGDLSVYWRYAHRLDKAA